MGGLIKTNVQLMQDHVMDLENVCECYYVDTIII